MIFFIYLRKNSILPLIIKKSTGTKAPVLSIFIAFLDKLFNSSFLFCSFYTFSDFNILTRATIQNSITTANGKAAAMDIV